MRLIILLISLSLFSLESKAQFVDKEMEDFILNANQLPKETAQMASFYAFEMRTKKRWKPDTRNGLFCIGIHVSHTYRHIMLIADWKRTYIDTYKVNTEEALLTVFKFLNENDLKFSDYEKLHYVWFVTYLYDVNHKYRGGW